MIQKPIRLNLTLSSFLFENPMTPPPPHVRVPTLLIFVKISENLRKIEERFVRGDWRDPTMLSKNCFATKRN